MGSTPESMVGTLRAKFRQLTKNADQKRLEKHGVVFEDTNSLTKEGRSAVVDMIWEQDAELRAAVLAKLTALDDEAEKAAKKNKS